MRPFALSAVAGLAGILAFALPQPAGAMQIEGYLTNLVDPIPGQDRWRVTYTVTEWSGYAADYGFSVRIPQLLTSA